MDPDDFNIIIIKMGKALSDAADEVMPEAVADRFATFTICLLPTDDGRLIGNFASYCGAGELVGSVALKAARDLLDNALERGWDKRQVRPIYRDGDDK